MTNDEMNIHDEFEDWLKQSADKHRMYPSDKLWRNINGQLHEQHNWPALTFGAILTMALLTATLVFLHPTKNVFTTPAYAYTITPSITVKKAAIPASAPETVKVPGKVIQKEPVYAFNTTSIAPETTTLPIEYASEQSLDILSSTENGTQKVGSEVVLSRSFTPKANINTLTTSNFTTQLSTETAAVSQLDAAVPATTKEVEPKAVEEEPPTSYNNARTIRLPEAHKKRWHVEVYGGSNISYRRLSESSFNNHIASSQPASSNRGDFNSLISQKPSVGINAGAAFVYALSDRLRIKAGFQLNFRQYNIDAYKSSFERSVLLLNNGFYYPDSVYTFSAISNEQGKAISLTNRYYQIGVPVGLEWTAVKLPNLHFNLAANLQPTYQINSNNYLLTSDYKSYVQAPNLLRRININAGVEATANFNAGNLQWQIGPQILYQTMPTQKANYSIHEHLIDYGVRVGIIKKL